jgi:hypothetical protein
VNRTEQAGVPLAAAALAVMGLVGGCSTDTTTGPVATGRGATAAVPSASPSASSPSSGAAAAAAKAVAAAQQAAMVVNQPQARKDVTLTSCSRDGGVWVAKGVIANPGDAGALYTVVVSYVDAHWTVQARGTVAVTVAAHDTHSWQTSASVPPSAAVTCVLRGVARA